jgi:hypothetical protein
MSPESTRSVPFVNLSAYLREDFLRRMLHQALEFVPASPAPSSAAFMKALAPIPVPGFRQFSRAPRGLQVRAAVSRFHDSGAFVGSVLDVWLEANRPLVALVEEFLDAQGIPRERIRAEDGRFQDQWSLDEVFRLADLFCAAHPGDRDDVSLLLCCLTNRAPVGDNPATDDAAAPAQTDTPQ